MRQPAQQAQPTAPGFRQRMGELHTWCGVLFGNLLFTIFLMGTLSVFDREIDRWAQPHTRLPAQAAGEVSSLDQALPYLSRLAPERAAFWQIYPPSERVPTLRLGWSGENIERGYRDLNPFNAALLPEQGAPLGTQLFYPFHHSLHLKWLDLGEWLVGLAAMAMLVGVVSGVATHRRIFKDFFTFRPRKPLQRSALDLHNVTAVFALPFLFLVPLSGLIIFAATYLQPAIAWVYGPERGVYTQEALSRYSRAPAKAALSHRASLDGMAARARAHWAASGQPGEVGLVIVRRPRDAHAVVEVRRASGARVGLEQGTQYFDAASGALLHAEALPTASRVQRFIVGMHLIQFDHWTLRWLYFVLGLGGCMMLATGNIVWVQKRAQRHARLGRPGANWLQALTLAAVCGPLLASTGVMLLNGLPHAWWTFGASPLLASMRWFFSLWSASLLHAVVMRDGMRHVAQQCMALAVTAGTAIAANVLFHGGSAVAPWPGAHPAALGVNMGLLLVAAGATLMARRQLRSERASRPEPGLSKAAA